MTDTRDTTPQPPPCCDPSAPVVKCCVCGTDVHTCERTEPVDNDYRCPAHVNGVEMSAGEWVCSDACGYELILAANWKRIAALEAQLAEAQRRMERIHAIVTRLIAKPGNHTEQLVEIATICETRADEPEGK